MSADLQGLFDVPGPPDFSISWDALAARHPWMSRLRDVPQDPAHHAEGDVFLHTCMVCEALAASKAFRGIPDADRVATFLGALFHDLGKADTTRIAARGEIVARGHSLRGSILSRQILWRLQVPFPLREAVCGLVWHHQIPFWLLERDDPQFLLARLTQTTRADLLTMVAEADAQGRVCSDQESLLEKVALFGALCEEHGCLTRPFPFPSDHARFLYLSERQRDPYHAPHEGFRCEVVLMSGLPGAGKDRFVSEHLGGWPVVSLDRLRNDLDVVPEERQGVVVARAKEEAREHLRAGRSFVWNATNLSRRVRAGCVRLFADYGARVRIVYVEVPESVLRAQNRSRARPVPDRVIDGLLDRWEVPDITEAHEVTHGV